MDKNSSCSAGAGIRIVFADMDGTFCADDKSVPRANLEAVHELSQRGIIFAACTGRHFGGLPQELLQPGMAAYAICDSGASIYRTGAGPIEVIDSSCVPRKTVEEIYERLEKLDIEIDIYVNRSIYTPATMYPYFEKERPFLSDDWYRYLDEVRTRFDGTYEDILDAYGDPYRLNVFFTTEEEAKVVKAVVDSITSVRGIRALPINTEITNVKASKGSAAKRLCERLGISFSDAFAIGDGPNDYSMVSMAGIGAAVSNADDDLKSAASIVSTSNNDAGFAHALHLAGIL